MSGPDQLAICVERSSPLLINFAKAGFSLMEVMWLGLSPLAFKCNEAWKPILEIVCAKTDYHWEWIPDPYPPETIFPEWYIRPGEAMLTKVH